MTKKSLAYSVFTSVVLEVGIPPTLRAFGFSHLTYNMEVEDIEVLLLTKNLEAFREKTYQYFNLI